MPRRRRYTDAQLEKAVATGGNLNTILKTLGLVPRGGNYETVRRQIWRLGLQAPHLEAQRTGPRSTRHVSTDEEIQLAVEVSRSFAELCRRVGISPYGRAQTALAMRVRALGLDTSHFSGAGWRRGSTTPVVPAAPLEEFLVEGRPCQSSALRGRLIREGLKEAMCETCGNVTWNGSPIPLELDHVNGRRDDNRLENLRLLCPNCHAQTDTYRGRNIGRTSGIL